MSELLTDSVLTLIAADLDPHAPSLVRDALFQLGGESGPPDWLAPGHACDIPFGAINPDQADAAARAAVGPMVDVVAQAAGGRRKSLLVADMESTLIRNEMLDELADTIGLRDRVSAITARAMNGELEFEGALRERVALLRGLAAAALADAARRIDYMPGAVSLVRTMRAAGAYTVLVSGGFSYFADLVQRHLSIDLARANILLVADGLVTGEVGEPILGRRAKFDMLVEIAAERRLPLSAALTVGDGANDLDMIEAAGLGIAFRAKPAVRSRARCRIDRADLTALLFAQGYRASEIVAAPSSSHQVKNN